MIARGLDVTDVDAYRTVRPPSRSLDLTQVNAVTFTSSSTTRNFLAMLDGDGRDALNHVAVFCIGPVTADTARELGLRVDAVAKEHTIEGLVSVMVEYYRRTDERGGRQGAVASSESIARLQVGGIER